MSEEKSNFVAVWWRNLTQEDALRVFRQAAMFGGGYAVGHGYITGEQLAEAIGIGVSTISFLWSLRANSLPNKVIEVNKSDEVTVKPTASASDLVKEAIKQ